jgi:hypothetical protein
MSKFLIISVIAIVANKKLEIRRTSANKGWVTIRNDFNEEILGYIKFFSIRRRIFFMSLY